jgi:hypothetical protein
MTPLSLVLLLGTLAVPTPASNVQIGISKTYEQTHFGVEEKIVKPVTVPSDALRILRQDEISQTCVAEGKSADQIPASWFVASAIHLNGEALPDLIVTAGNSCLFGANVNPFWVFAHTQRGYKLVLSLSALGLDVMPRKVSGYRSIRASAATANQVFTTIFKYDGRRYVAQRRFHKRTGR